MIECKELVGKVVCQVTIFEDGNYGPEVNFESFAIVTTDPSEWMEKYHDRMGVIIKPKDYHRWFEEGEEHSLPLDLLRPYPEEEMQSWRVSDDVGNTRNNWAELIEPIPEDTPKREKTPKRAKSKKEPPTAGLFE